MCERNVYIFGNSPNSNINAEIKKEDDIAVLGDGIKYLKDKKIKYWFTRITKYSKELSNLSEKTFLLNYKKYKSQIDEDNMSNNVYWLHDYSILTLKDYHNIKIVPSLGMAAILYLKEFYENIYISGITLNKNDSYVEYGHFWNKKNKRHNHHHNISIEILYLNKLLKDGIICKF